LPRTARIKYSGAIYHIMSRSISEVSLFQDNDDKSKYLCLIEKYKKLYQFRVYAYCLMTTHAHIIIDCCGADISKIMKSINLSYVLYFNKKYSRHGHLFQDRFKSKVVTDNRYLRVLSAYIHNNAKDIGEFKGCIEKYEFSSLGIYLGLKSDNNKIVDYTYMLQSFGINISEARTAYVNFLNNRNKDKDKIDINFKEDKSEYISSRKVLIRDLKIDEIVEFVSKYSGIEGYINIKYSHSNTEFKALCVVLMRSLGNYSLKEVCEAFGNITASTAWRLCEKGLSLIKFNIKYSTIIDDMILQFKAE
jgi:putative transposase